MDECWLEDGVLTAVGGGMSGKAQAWKIMMRDPLVGVEGRVRVI